MLVRMRFPAQALDELRKDDPTTPVTLNCIRALAASGKIPVMMVGKRRLINYDAMLAYFQNPPPEQPQSGTIRRIDEQHY